MSCCSCCSCCCLLACLPGTSCTCASGTRPAIFEHKHCASPSLHSCACARACAPPPFCAGPLRQVGVEINLAANVSWRRDMLSFVPGLGPRKAQALLQAIARINNRVESRIYMYREMNFVLGKVVFR